MLSATAWKATLALLVGSITASEQYRALTLDPACASTFFTEVVAVVCLLGAVYTSCAFWLVGLSLHEALPPKTWRQAGATFLTAMGFGLVVLLLAPIAYSVGSAVAVFSTASGYAIVLRTLDSHPNIAGAMLGSFVFMLSAQLLQGLAGRVFGRHRGEA